MTVVCFSPIFSVLAILYCFPASATDIDSSDDLTSWILGGTGPIKSSVTTDGSEFLEICSCLSHVADVKACSISPKYEIVIHDGICYKNLRTKTKRSDTIPWASLLDEAILSSPPAFFESKKCQGTQNIIIASSGAERKLYLTTKASVFICPESIDLGLQQLDIFSVSQIVIAPGSLKPRNSSITIHFSDIQEKVVFPEGAFSVNAESNSSLRNPNLIEQESSSIPPIEVNLEVNSAADIEFQGRSLVAPIVSLKLTNIKFVVFGPKAIIPYIHPEASGLDINNCHSVVLGPHAIMNTGRFEAKYVEILLMKERAVEIADDFGARAKVEHVTNMTILDEGLSIGRGADIIFDNVTLTSAGVRSIQGANRGSLRRATFLHINGKQLSSVALCIKTETAVIFNIEMAGKEGQTGACIEAQHVHGIDSSGTLLICDRLEKTKVICDDPRCEQCVFDAEETSATRDVSFPFRITTYNDETFIGALDEDSSSNHTARTTQTSLVSLEKATTDSSTTSIPTKASTQLYSLSLTEREEEETVDDMKPSFLEPLRGTPLYVIIIILCVLVILIFFAAYMVYKCCTCNKHDKYYLPQENRLSTFHNPRTIMTPENLSDKNNSQKFSNYGDHGGPSTYNSYRGQPIVTYLVHSDTQDVANPRSYTDCQVTTNQLEAKQIISNYQQPNFESHYDFPLGQHRCFSEDYLHSDNEMPHENQIFHGSQPKELYLTSPDEYVQESDMQMSYEDVNLSEDNPSQ